MGLLDQEPKGSNNETDNILALVMVLGSWIVIILLNYIFKLHILCAYINYNKMFLQTERIKWIWEGKRVRKEGNGDSF